jgi:hypothetical protein
VNNPAHLAIALAFGYGLAWMTEASAIDGYIASMVTLVLLNQERFP